MKKFLMFILVSILNLVYLFLFPSCTDGSCNNLANLSEDKLFKERLEADVQLLFRNEKIIEENYFLTGPYMSLLKVESLLNARLGIKAYMGNDAIFRISHQFESENEVLYLGYSLRTMLIIEIKKNDALYGGSMYEISSIEVLCS